MADGIADFNPRDGLEPLVVQKLNNNFQSLLRMFMPLAINMVAQSEEPEPRTDETLWYDTDNGDLYIWAQGVDLTTGRPNGEWDWKKVDLDIVKLGTGEPVPYNASDGQLFYYDVEHHLLYVYTAWGHWEAGYPEDVYYEDTPPQWWTIPELVAEYLRVNVFDPDGDLNEEFGLAVLDIVYPNA